MDFYQRVLALAGLDDTPENRLKVEMAFEWANRYCRRNYTHDDAPAGFLMGVAILAKSTDQPPNVVSEAVAGGISVTYSTEATGPAAGYLNAYRRVVFR